MKKKNRSYPDIDVSKLKVETGVKMKRKTCPIKNPELIELVNSMKSGESVFIPLDTQAARENYRMRLRYNCTHKIRSVCEPDGLRVWKGEKKPKKGGE